MFWQKESIPVTSIFSFSYSVIKSTFDYLTNTKILDFSKQKALADNKKT